MRIEKLIFATALLLFSGALFAQTKVDIQDVDMTISGTSSLHDWTSSVTEASAQGQVSLDGSELNGINNLVVTIPVTSIKSDKGSGTMDNKTYKALESDDHPNIVYQLIKVNSIQKMGDSYKLSTEGKLTIAGDEEVIKMDVTAKPAANGTLLFTGSKSIKMTDFGIDPPTALLGTLKTGDDITIDFTVTLKTHKS